MVYCTECSSELSREDKTIDALGHTPGESVEENRVEPTCTTAGSYDEVVCGEELSRETKTIEATGHVLGERRRSGPWYQQHHAQSHSFPYPRSNRCHFDAV